MKKTNQSFVDEVQLFSIFTSFVSLSLSSIKLFYSQRLGRYPEIDPSLKMMAFAFPFVAVLIAGPLCSLVIAAAYLKGWVIVFIGLIITCHTLALNLPSLQDRLFPFLFFLYAKYPSYTSSPGQPAREANDARSILFTANCTSWISPCTVWINTFMVKSYFLIFSSSVCSACHLLGLLTVYLYSMFAQLTPTDHAPVSHCFTSIDEMAVR